MIKASIEYTLCGLHDILMLLESCAGLSHSRALITPLSPQVVNEQVEVIAYHFYQLLDFFVHIERVRSEIARARKRLDELHVVAERSGCGKSASPR